MSEKTLYNRGQRVYTMPSGEVGPGKTITVSDEEYRLHADYPDLIEFSKLNVSGSKELKELREENKRLKEKLEEEKSDKPVEVENRPQPRFIDPIVNPAPQEHKKKGKK